MRARLRYFCIIENYSKNETDEFVEINEEDIVFVSTSDTRLGYVLSDVGELSQNGRNQRMNEYLRKQV